MKDLLVLPQLDNFKNGEFSKYIRTIIELSAEQDLDGMGIIAQAYSLKINYAEYKTVYKKNRGSALTSELATYDLLRDNALKLVQRSVKLIADFTHNEHDRQQANLVYKVFSKHGKEIYNMAYNQQGGVMDEIIEEIENDTALGKAIDVLNQRVPFNQMKEAHRSFDTIFKDRIKEQQKEQSNLSIIELRKRTSKALRELLEWIFIRAKTKGIEQFETYIGNLNSLTEQYNLSIERRLHSKTSTEQELDDDFDPNQGEI